MGARASSPASTAPATASAAWGSPERAARLAVGLSLSRFDSTCIAGLDEPVRRYFAHAIADGASLAPAVRLTMSGKIRLGAWVPFSAVELLDGRSFDWQARVALGPVTLLRAHDRYADGEGAMTVRLGGRLPVVRATDEDTVRSAAGRAAVEAIWSPCALLPQRGIDWRAEADDHIVAAWSLPPERPQLQLRIDERGGVLRAWVSRRRGQRYVPCSASVEAERRFGDLVVPSALEVAWGEAAPFFRATVTGLARSDPDDEHRPLGVVHEPG